MHLYKFRATDMRKKGADNSHAIKLETRWRRAGFELRAAEPVTFVNLLNALEEVLVASNQADLLLAKLINKIDVTP